MMTYSKINNLLGWGIFLLSFSVYWLTKEPTVSFWDCGEFIAAAYKLQVVHQPGAPLFLLIQNIIGNLALGNTAYVAFWMNAASALASALTILFLFWSITALSKKILSKTTDDPSLYTKIFSAGIIGALAFTFSDSFWFSAVESEVYALSSLCTAIVFWLILKWDARADGPRATKWLLLLAYLMGLSIGVHLLNLLTIPVIGLSIYIRMNDKVTAKGIFKTLLWSFALLAFILWGVIQYLLKAAAQVELFFVNGLGLSFGSGLICFALALTAALILGIWHTQRKGKALANLGLLGFVFVLLGYGSFAMVAIRASTGISLNNYSPDNIFNFIEYVTRDQYPSSPLITGPFYDSRPSDIKEGNAIYRKDEDKYALVKHKPEYAYDRTSLFPRIHDNRKGDFYRSWLQIGDGQKPTFADNIRFFISYQANVMYWRYFLWNFVGRQNDQEGQTANYTDGNWLSGVTPIDQARLGGQYALPDEVQGDPSRNTYFFFPLLLGITGLIWHYRRDKKTLSIVALFFFFTGLAIVLYLNDSPIQPRERDYVYVGSFYVFAIWIGLGVIALQELMARRLTTKYASPLAFGSTLLAVPMIMALQGWDDHDRSERYTARDLYAHNYLASCEPNAILFTLGDNDTYPLWYAQEVEKFRTDVRVVNIGLLATDWYARQMKEKINDAEALPITIKDEQMAKGVRDYLDYYDYGIEGHVDIEKLLNVMLSDNPNDKLETRSGERVNFLPTQKMKLAINKEEAIAHNTVPQAWEHLVTDSMEWEFNDNYITRAHLVVLDVLAQNHWQRPIYFTQMPSSELMGLDNYLINEGLVSKLMPIALPQETDTPSNHEAIYSNLVNKFAYGNLKEQRHLDPLSRNMVAQLSIEMGQLSQDLLHQQDNEKAKNVANKVLEVMPDKIYSLNQAVGLYFTTDTLYEVNETAKAQQLLEQNADYVYGQLNYWADIAKTKPNYNSIDIRRGMGLLNAMVETASKHNDTKMTEKIKERYAAIEDKLTSI